MKKILFITPDNEAAPVAAAKIQALFKQRLSEAPEVVRLGCAMDGIRMLESDVGKDVAAVVLDVMAKLECSASADLKSVSNEAFGISALDVLETIKRQTPKGFNPDLYICCLSGELTEISFPDCLTDVIEDTMLLPGDPEFVFRSDLAIGLS